MGRTLGDEVATIFEERSEALLERARAVEEEAQRLWAVGGPPERARELEAYSRYLRVQAAELARHAVLLRLPELDADALEEVA
jgi:acyl-CoA reductase-like NAD-dependent aldehyde dehydrogenase